eukprot:SM004570S16330  [mRNA]  locus=s4570:384:1201:+ [translate_table: standard]
MATSLAQGAAALLALSFISLLVGTGSAAGDVGSMLQSPTTATREYRDNATWVHRTSDGAADGIQPPIPGAPRASSPEEAARASHRRVLKNGHGGMHPPKPPPTAVDVVVAAVNSAKVSVRALQAIVKRGGCYNSLKRALISLKAVGNYAPLRDVFHAKKQLNAAVARIGTCHKQSKYVDLYARLIIKQLSSVPVLLNAIALPPPPHPPPSPPQPPPPSPPPPAL